MAMRQRPMPQKKSNHDDDSVIYKIMAALVMLCVLLVGLQITSRYYSVVGTMFTTQTVLLGVGIASSVLFLASVGLWFYSRRLRPLLHAFSWILGIFFLVVALSCWVLYVTWVSYIPYLYAVYIAVTVLYMIALLYQPEFFLLSCVNVAAGGVFYALSRLYSGRLFVMALYALLVVVIAVVALVVFKARRTDDGILKLGKRSIAIATANTSPLPVYLSCVVWVLCLAVAAFLGSVFAYYCIFAVAAFELAAAVYYTVKLA
ncbi:hypothetical protein ACTQ33_01700 [Candidatus Avoscillospira sp. LCP25S3_F1]|uniref:hypothetical protein n=1 Tax=Candidatus Avoscillospira sp. LCP25S3_F1 TaxID=3438825 RepID=UPI003F9323F2